MMRRQQQNQQSRVFHDLSALVLNILGCPPSRIDFSENVPVVSTGRVASSSRSSLPTQISPVGFASLLLGISFALMLCGSVTFFIGFMLMPWVLGLVIVFGIVSALSMVGRSMLCCATAPSSPKKEIAGWKL